MTSTRRDTLRTAEQLLAGGLIADHDLARVEEISRRFAIAITPHVRDLIAGASIADPMADPIADPIAAQFVPSHAELALSADELEDPIGDGAHMPLPGIVHRYPDRVLFKPMHVCPVYCRFCFRREMVGPGSESLTDEQIDNALAYIESRQEIWEVVVSGGDPLIMSARRIRHIMNRLQSIAHIGVVRFHTRVPVVKPDAVTQGLIEALRIKKAVYIVLHTNHVNELSDETKAVCARLIDAGFPMLSQTVLLRGVNADASTLEQLFRALVEMRIKPYYLHHGDLARGTKHFRTSIADGQQIMRSLRGHVSGLCQPLYVLDIPGGNGKVPIGPVYLNEQAVGQYRVEDYKGNQHSYQESLRR
ncbi:MAG: lysine-2,3-aminomutase-like protein [Pseudomonadota bacterium]|nr:lysine-2,3-aminomutase-like protein [Pseudomonadota bacterium]